MKNQIKIIIYNNKKKQIKKNKEKKSELNGILLSYTQIANIFYT